MEHTENWGQLEPLLWWDEQREYELLRTIVVFGLHDHPWGERPVFSKVRYMSASVPERKAKPRQYVEKVEQRTRGIG